MTWGNHAETEDKVTWNGKHFDGAKSEEGQVLTGEFEQGGNRFAAYEPKKYGQFQGFYDHLAGLREITDDGLQSLEALSSLKSLDLSFCQQLTNEGLSSVGMLANLESLNLLGFNKITDADLESRRRTLPRLKVGHVDVRQNSAG